MARSGVVYRYVVVGSELVEICDECGFNGALIGIPEVPRRLGAIREAWSAVLACDESLLRARPEPATWCAVEYGQHTAFVLSGIEWAARLFMHSTSPDWTMLPDDPLGDATDSNHRCGSFGVSDTLDGIDQASTSLASFTESLTDRDLDATADYGDGLIINTRAVIRHALHDAEHHTLDVRRGIARLVLNG